MAPVPRARAIGEVIFFCGIPGRIIRTNSALADLPVIAYTAHAQPEDRRSFIASGFNEVLIKPVNRETLASAVASVMQHQVNQQ